MLGSVGTTLALGTTCSLYAVHNLLFRCVREERTHSLLRQACTMPGLVHSPDVRMTVRTVSFPQLYWGVLHRAVSDVVSTLDSAGADDSLEAVCHRTRGTREQLSAIQRYLSTELPFFTMTLSALRVALSEVALSLQSLLRSAPRALAWDEMEIRSVSLEYETKVRAS